MIFYIKNDKNKFVQINSLTIFIVNNSGYICTGIFIFRVI